jgi:hypothetical protein
MNVAWQDCPQVPQRAEQVAPGAPTKDAVLVLQAEDIEAPHVEKVRCPLVGRDVALGNFEDDFFVILVALTEIVHGDDPRAEAQALFAERARQIRGEGCDSALPG